MDLLVPLDTQPAVAPAPLWMITFADLLSLLLAFFVLLYATTSADQQRWQARIAPIAKFLSGEEIDHKPAVGPATPAATTDAVKDLGYIRALLEGLTTGTPAFAGASVARGPHEVTLRAPRAADSDDGRAALARILGALDNAAEIRVIRQRPSETEAGGGQLWQLALADAETLRADLARRCGRHDLIATGAVGGSITRGNAADSGYLELRLSNAAGPSHGGR